MIDREVNQAIRALLRTLDDHAPGERIHAQRVAVYAVATGYELGLRDDDLLRLRWSAELHDIGKLLVEAEVLKSLSPLDDSQIAEARMHTLWAKAALNGYEHFLPVVRTIRLHHERWDGSGHPFGHRGEETPLLSRIIGVAEWFDVAANGTYWCPGLGEEPALDEVRCQPFDPIVVEALLKVQPLIQPVS